MHTYMHTYIHTYIFHWCFVVLPLLYVYTYIQSPQFTGKGVEPVVHRDWDGGPITLPRGGLTLDPSDMPALQRVAALKDTIITASGDTLLGADDKSGVALLMAVARRLLSLPPEQRGCEHVCEGECARTLHAYYAHTLHTHYTAEGARGA